MKELLIVVCVLLISWCISKMMPEIENEKGFYANEVIQGVLDYSVSFVVVLRYFGSVRPIISLGVALIVFGIVNMKDWIQLRKKKDLVY